MQAKVQDKSFGMDVYDCKLTWPDESEFTVYESVDAKTDFFAELSTDEGLPVQKEPRYSFIGYVPAPENIPVRNRFYSERGLQRKKITITGCGPSFEAAEATAHANLEKIKGCEHKWHRHTMSDPNRSMLLDGCCSCYSGCGVFVNGLQMDDTLFRAMNLAYEAHEGQYRKYGKGDPVPYINHPYRVYSRVAWWRVLPEAQWLLMAKAAWLHDTLEDCPQITKERIIAETDEETYKLVAELTNPSKGSKAPRWVRKQMDRDHLAHVSWEAKIIKLFDRIENLKDMEECPEKDFMALYASESRQLLECLKDADEGLAKELLSWIKAVEKWSKSYEANILEQK